MSWEDRLEDTLQANKMSMSCFNLIDMLQAFSIESADEFQYGRMIKYVDNIIEQRNEEHQSKTKT